jgi:hypothetical protein
VTTLRGLLPIAIAVMVALLVAVWLTVESRAQSIDKPVLAGSWTLNRDLSDQPPGRGEDGVSGRRGRGSGGGRGGGGGGGRSAIDRERIAQQQEAARDILNSPAHLIISDTGTMIGLTGPDGRTTRLSPDGRTVKDENTNIERKTTWRGGRLVSEVSGAGPSKIVQTFSLDAENHRRLRIVVDIEGGQGGQRRTRTYVYDADGR